MEINYIDIADIININKKYILDRVTSKPLSVPASTDLSNFKIEQDTTDNAPVEVGTTYTKINTTIKKEYDAGLKKEKDAGLKKEKVNKILNEPYKVDIEINNPQTTDLSVPVSTDLSVPASTDLSNFKTEQDITDNDPVEVGTTYTKINATIKKEYDDSLLKEKENNILNDPYKVDNEINYIDIADIININKKYILDRVTSKPLSVPASTDLSNFVPDITSADKTFLTGSKSKTGLSIVDGFINNVDSTLNSVVNYGNQFKDAFRTTPKGPSEAEKSNLVLTELKGEVKKTVNLSTINTIPYSVDKTLKAFNSGDLFNSIISGTLGILSEAMDLADSFYDAEEVTSILSANFNSLTATGNNTGKYLSFLGYSTKPAIKIKSVIDGKYKNFEPSQKIKNYESKANLGYLYIRPFMNKIAIDPFNIPFQMNAKVTEEGISAVYASEQFLNRVGEIMAFTGTSSQKMTLETSYLVLSEDGTSFSTGNNLENSFWMTKWTPEYVKTIENAYRSLVFSTYYSGIDNENESIGGFLKPPVIRVIMTTSNENGVSDLYAYPTAKWELNAKDSSWGNKATGNNFASTLNNLEKDGTLTGNYKWNKAFVATNVSITHEDDTGINYSLNKSQFYTGFKVIVQLTEVTENYLDCIPDFASYYSAFVGGLKYDTTPPPPTYGAGNWETNASAASAAARVEAANKATALSGGLPIPTSNDGSLYYQ